MKTPTYKVTIASLAFAFTTPFLVAQSAATEAGRGSNQNANTPASPVDPTGRALDRGSGNNPNRLSGSAAMQRGDKKGSHLIGTNVRSGDRSGEIKDLVIDSKSGRISHVIIGSGGVLGVGETRHALPYNALQPGADGDEMMIEQGEWQRAPLFRDDQLAALSSGSGAAAAEQGEGAVGSGKNAGALVLASRLNGQEIEAGGEELGEIEDLLIQPDRTAALLVDVEDDFVGNDQTYVISFDRVSIAGSGDDLSITSTLTQNDFAGTAATPGDRGSSQPYVYSAERIGMTDRFANAAAGDRRNDDRTRAGSPTTTGTDGEPMVRFEDPTDETARQRTPAVASATQAEQIQAVRQIIRSDSAARDVTVRARGQDVVLSGTVPSEDVRERVLQSARTAAAGMTVEDELKIRGAAE
ncbi:MAG TPA: PRC-barrel domain-containing protein [Candidatus Synoicihabitans sp.]|nr:PRC-barrel domain-containing protein [Candidatus Synoicihabitans sp.]